MHRLGNFPKRHKNVHVSGGDKDHNLCCHHMSSQVNLIRAIKMELDTSNQNKCHSIFTSQTIADQNRILRRLKRGWDDKVMMT